MSDPISPPPSLPPLTPPGFYRVVFDGCVGIGYCRHEKSITGGHYEDWSLMYLRSMAAGEKQHIWNAHINSMDQSRSRLVVGNRVRGPAAPRGAA